MPEVITTTFSFFRSDKLVYTTVSLRPICLANLLRQWQDLSFLTSRIPTRPFQVEFTIFTDACTETVGAPRWGIPRFQFWTRSDRKFHINNLDLKVILALHHWVSLGHQLMIATDNTTVVAYINKQGWTHSHVAYINKRHPVTSSSGWLWLWLWPSRPDTFWAV